MNSLENFKSRCTNDEVKKLLGQVPLEVLLYIIYTIKPLRNVKVTLRGRNIQLRQVYICLDL